MRSAATLKAPDKKQEGSVNLKHQDSYRGLTSINSYGGDHDFGKIRVHNNNAFTAGSLRIQPKLKINQPGDVYEREADAMAEKVMRKENDAPIHAFSHTGISVQRKCAHCEEEEEKIQRKESGGASPVVTPAVEQTLGSGGQPMDTSTRSFMEQRFGYDFGNVRIHDDAMAHKSSNDIAALAYTHGNHIVFGSSQYRPDTNSGKLLLAHELTHTVQQSSDFNDTIQLRGDKAVAESKKPLEIESAKSELRNIKSGWKKILDLVKGRSIDPEWIVKGEKVIKLIHSHTDLAIDSYNASDMLLYETYLDVLKTDLISYRYIYSHVVSYYNLGIMRSWVEDANDSFKHDDRDFKGRPAAEHYAQLLKALIDTETTKSSQFLAVIDTEIKFNVILDGVSKATIRSTNAVDKIIRDQMEAEIEAVLKYDESAQILAQQLEIFFNDATEEGFYQAIEAVEEYFAVKKLLSPDKAEAKVEVEQRETKPTPVVDPAPPLVPPDTDKEKKKCRLPTGLTESDPIPIKWCKPVHDSFYPKYLDLTDGRIDRDDPHAKLPDDTPIGVEEERWPKVGKTFQRIKQPRLGQEAKFKRKLKIFGYDWKGDKTSPDHVQDVFWNGRDEFGNLWPYESSTNASVGGLQNLHQKISFCESSTGQSHIRKRLLDVDAIINYRWFVIAYIDNNHCV